VYFESAGVAAASLTPTWEFLITAENGTDRSGDGPAITEVGGAGNGGGWYKYSIVYGTAPWQTVAEDLLGSIDGGAGLAAADRYMPVKFLLADFAHIIIAHKAIQTKSTGDIIIYGLDGTTGEFKRDFTDGSTTITRAPAAPA